MQAAALNHRNGLCDYDTKTQPLRELPDSDNKCVLLGKSLEAEPKYGLELEWRPIMGSG